VAETPLRRFVSDYFASWIATVAIVILLLITCLALLAPVLAPQNPYNLAEVDILDSRLPPGSMGMAAIDTGSAPMAPAATSSAPSCTGCASR
jgi:hypothetical protein